MARPKIFQIPATLDGLSTRKDGSMGVRFTTQELDDKNKAKLLSFANAFGWLQFSNQELHSIPDKPPTREVGAKTPSQRLRGAIMVLHKQRYGDMPSEVFYEQTMEKIISRVKEELT